MNKEQRFEDDKKFNDWWVKVDIALVNMCGMGVEDLPDYCYRDAFNAGQTPREVARDVIAAAKDY